MSVRFLACVLAVGLGAAPAGWAQAADHAGVPERLVNRSPSLGRQEEGHEVFSRESRLISEGRVFSVATHDVNGDGRPDIIVSDYLNPARILYNDSALTFAEVVPLTATEETATTGHGVALGDFNGDGRLDLFLVYNGFPSHILFADGVGGFTDGGRAIGTLGLSGTSVEVADVDQDGDLDAFVTYYQERARLYLNDGTGTLSESDQTFFAVMPLATTTTLHLVDVDGDGDLDLLGAGLDRETGESDLRLFLNTLSGTR